MPGLSLCDALFTALASHFRPNRTDGKQREKERGGRGSASFQRYYSAIGLYLAIGRVANCNSLRACVNQYWVFFYHLKPNTWFHDYWGHYLFCEGLIWTRNGLSNKRMLYKWVLYVYLLLLETSIDGDTILSEQKKQTLYLCLHFNLNLKSYGNGEIARAKTKMYLWYTNFFLNTAPLWVRAHALQRQKNNLYPQEGSVPKYRV